MKRCSYCRITKPDTDFWTREDTGNLYSFCIECCEKQVRSKDWPPKQERGGGVLYPDYRTVTPEYLVDLSKRGL